MKERLFNNWTIIRVLYLIMGIGILIQAVLLQAWLGLFVGAYFAAMGLFAFGCAGGNCYKGTCDMTKTRNKTTQ